MKYLGVSQRNKRFVHWKLQNIAERNEENTKWKDFLCSWFEIFVLFMFQYYLKWFTNLIYPYQTPMIVCISWKIWKGINIYTIWNTPKTITTAIMKNVIQKLAKGLTFFQWRWAKGNKHMERCLTSSLSIRAMQIKTYLGEELSRHKELVEQRLQCRHSSFAFLSKQAGHRGCSSEWGWSYRRGGWTGVDDRPWKPCKPFRGCCLLCWVGSHVEGIEQRSDVLKLNCLPLGPPLWLSW